MGFCIKIKGFGAKEAMTKKEQQLIIKLRLVGLGYKAIAQKLNMSRDSIRGFCKRNALDGVAEAAMKNYADKGNEGLVCKNCGLIMAPQTGRGRHRQFCSDKCRSVWWNKNYELHNFGSEPIHTFICVGCSKQFTVYSKKNRKYCSHECYIKHRFGGK